MTNDLDHIIAGLKSALNSSLPGANVQYEMAPLHRPKLEISQLAQGSYRDSAVLIPICSDVSGQVFIPLIRRHAYEGVHSAQVSLPGGKKDKSDVDLQATALRECYEEIGVKGVEVIGEISELYIPVSKYVVKPFIGYFKTVPHFRPDEREVERILKLYLDEFLADSAARSGTVEVSTELSVSSPYFLVEGHQVWGATAMILNEFRAILKQSIF